MKGQYAAAAAVIKQPYLILHVFELLILILVLVLLLLLHVPVLVLVLVVHLLNSCSPSLFVWL